MTRRHLYPIAPGLFLSLLLLSTLSFAAASAPDRYEIDVVLQPASRSLEATVRLTLDDFDRQSPSLYLSREAQVDRVEWAGREIPFRFEGGALSFSLPSGSGAGAEVLVAYRARFLDDPPEDPAHNEDPSYGVSGSISPTGVFLADGSGWYPRRPGASALFRVAVRAPQGFRAVTDGARLASKSVDGQSLSVWETTQPSSGLTLVAGPYQVKERRQGPVPLYAYFYADSLALADTYLDAAREYIALYRDLFGPYPFAKFAVVENFFPTGYGFPSWTLLGSTVVRLPFIVETSLGHEVAHCWWGNGVLVDYARGNWSEGLTTYVADHLYKQRSSPEEGRAYRLKLLRDYATLVPPEKDFALSAFTGRSSAASRAVGYGKSAMVFHMARHRVDDQAFWQGLRNLARDRLFARVSWADFASYLGRAGDEEMGPFFDQWVRRPGAPDLYLDRIEVKREEEGWVVSGRIGQRAPLYDLTVPLRLETAGKKVEVRLAIRDEATSFRIASEDAPRRLVLDPEVELFRRLDPSEIPPTVNAIRGSRSLLVVTARELSPQKLAVARRLLAALRQQDARVVAEDDLGAEDLTGHDLLFVGVPKNRALLPDMPKSLSLTPEGMLLPGPPVTGKGTAHFAALPHPAESSRVAAIFSMASAAGGRQAARKIPHYGKYSYLSFEDGVNRARGIWPVRTSPVIHEFTFEETNR